MLVEHLLIAVRVRVGHRASRMRVNRPPWGQNAPEDGIFFIRP